MNLIRFFFNILNKFSIITYMIELLQIFLMRNSTILQMFLDFCVAVGTLLAVYIALNRKRLSMRIGGPKLDISDPYYWRENNNQNAEGEITHFDFRFLLVKNIGYSTAENVKCVAAHYSLSEFQRKNKGGKKFRHLEPLPWHLTEHFRAPAETFKVDISPGEEVLVNFVCLRTKAASPPFEYFFMSHGYTDRKLNWVINNTGSDMYEEKVIIEVKLFCENAITKPYYFLVQKYKEPHQLSLEVKRFQP